MRLLMPTHVNAVQLYRDTQPVFAKAGVEQQLDAMFSNQVTLKSGGYIVINQTEALVAIDVNSGRSTREHNIEDTALRTNLEAADEIARQLRLRDLAGLIVVDFIDMEETRNNRAVERRIKDALKNDRARIQVGRISHFGLLEMSRQRIRTGVLEGSTVVCPHCQGAGVVRSTSSIALHVLRVLEDALIKSATHDIDVRTRTAVALYILNQKRAQPARSRAPLWRRDLGRGRRHADGRELSRHRARRAGERSAPEEIEPAPLAQDDFATIVDEPAVEEAVEDEVESDTEDEAAVAERAPAREAATATAIATARTATEAGGVGGADGAAAPIAGPAKASRRTRRSRPTTRLRSQRRSAATSPLQSKRAAQAQSPTETAAAAPAGRAADATASRHAPANLSRETKPSAPGLTSRSRSSDRQASPKANRFPLGSRSYEPVAASHAPRPPPVEPAVDDGGAGRTSRAMAPVAEGHGFDPRPEPEPQARAERAEAEADVGPAPAAPIDDPSRPRRTGWWQRARATIVGD